ncbi:hypothetical protein EON65_39795 [archaeon]|nr:MAG: hypothetical protein EON65_39795 [archaeon]
MIDKPFPSAVFRESSTMSSVRTEVSSKTPEDGVNLYHNNVCSVIWKTYIATQLAQQTQKHAQNAHNASNALYNVLGTSNTHSVYNLHKLNISPGISNKFQQGEVLSDGERNEVMKFILETLLLSTSQVLRKW